jgi:hypothetical protein
MMFAIKVVNEILTLSNKGLYYETLRVMYKADVLAASTLI